MFNAGGSNVVSFRRAKAPPLSLADSERRGVTSVASLNILAPDLPCHAEPLAFHAAQGFGEGLVCRDTLSTAHAIYGWVAICFVFDAGVLAAGVWVFG